MDEDEEQVAEFVGSLDPMAKDGETTEPAEVKGAGLPTIEAEAGSGGNLPPLQHPRPVLLMLLCATVYASTFVVYAAFGSIEVYSKDRRRTAMFVSFVVLCPSAKPVSPRSSQRGPRACCRFSCLTSSYYTCGGSVCWARTARLWLWASSRAAPSSALARTIL